MRLRNLLGPLISLVLFGLALAALRHFLRDYSLGQVLDEARRLPREAILGAIGLTAVSYLVLTGYDALALRYVGRRVSYRYTAFTSFISYSISHNVGVSLLSGGTARLRIYSARGLSALDVTQVILFCNLTFWVGFLALGGVVLNLVPVPLPETVNLPFASSRAVGVACAVSMLALWIWIHRGPKEVRIKRVAVRMPTDRIFLGQIVVASLDWALAAAVLWAVLPPELGPYPTVLAMFLLAQILAMASNVPGGMGVFETVIFFVAPPDLEADRLMGALLVYRAVYYVLPLVIAAPLLIGQEWLRRRR